MTEPVTVEVEVHAPIEKVWAYWNEPEHIVLWCVGSPDWHTPKAENDLRVGGKFVTTMAAKDGSTGFDICGTYTHIVPHERIEYTMDDGRHVVVLFETDGDETHITEVFDPEMENTLELQRAGWQGILDRFIVYVESH